DQRVGPQAADLTDVLAGLDLAAGPGQRRLLLQPDAVTGRALAAGVLAQPGADLVALLRGQQVLDQQVALLPDAGVGGLGGCGHRRSTPRRGNVSATSLTAGPGRRHGLHSTNP